ncbi:MAG: KUP/HAK/KT family potassium transporter [Bacteroidia bacterium]
MHNTYTFRWGLVLVALGVVYGDIGTSPLYTLRAVVGEGVIDPPLVIGAVSCVFWALTLIVTVKYATFVLRADNQGEGGIFALYALVRKGAPWTIYAAIFSAGMLFADAAFTPSISVTSALEGLKVYNPDLNITPLVIVIIVGLFVFQQFGTLVVGKAFGPITLVWFLWIGLWGGRQILHNPQILQALSPLHAWEFLTTYPEGFWKLGSVFLAITGVEALYADMGHVGKINLRIGWSFVKLALLLNYFGQGAWLLTQEGNVLAPNQTPFYALFPSSVMGFTIFLATLATIIASQAVITGSYSIFTEAMRLGVWPRMQILHPAETRGQMYVPFINWFLMANVLIIVLTLRSSHKMEAAYGLAINFTLLVTTLLTTLYFFNKGYQKRALILGLLFGSVEVAFLISNVSKFSQGGWIAFVVGIGIITTMLIWHLGEKIRARYDDQIDLSVILPQLQGLIRDEEVPRFASHLVYLTGSALPTQIENRIPHSIFNRGPKKADTYWFIHVHNTLKPREVSYQVTQLIPQRAFRIDFYLGFKIQPRLSLLFRHVIQDLQEQIGLDIRSRYKSLRQYGIPGDFKFILVRRVMQYDFLFRPWEKIILNLHSVLDFFAQSKVAAFGIDTTNVYQEAVPLRAPMLPKEMVPRPRGPLRILEHWETTPQEALGDGKRV